jgi:hypothetical protein
MKSPLTALRAPTLTFWLVVVVFLLVVMLSATIIGRSVDPEVTDRTSAPTEQVLRLRTEALRVAADAARGFDVSKSAEALALRSDDVPGAEKVASSARSLAAGTGSYTELALAADRLLLTAGPVSRATPLRTWSEPAP